MRAARGAVGLRGARRSSYYELPQVDNRRALVNAGLSGHEVGLIVATLDHSRPGEKPTHDGAQSGGFLYGFRAAMFPARIADANSSSSSTMRGSVRMPAPAKPSTVSQFFVGGRSPGVTTGAFNVFPPNSPRATGVTWRKNSTTFARGHATTIRVTGAIPLLIYTIGTWFISSAKGGVTGTAIT